MRNIVIIIAIFFWILNLISKNKKKQQQAAERRNIVRVNEAREAAHRNRAKRNCAAQTYPCRSIDALFQERQTQAPATDYELAYASKDYAASEKNTESSSVTAEHEPVSHFKRNYGMTASLGTESAEEKEAYDKDIPVIPRLSLTSGGIKQYIIAAEILGKPKALRR